MNELASAVEEFLHEKGAGEKHIKEQLNELKSKFSGWLP
jgi:hypothetical protein